MLRRGVQRAFRSIGYEIRRPREVMDLAPSLMVDDPLEAIHYARDDVSVAFRCPLDLVRDTKGFSFAAGGWHPWTAQLQEPSRGSPVYAGSLLERYYRTFRPADALAALAGFHPDAPCKLAELPSSLFWLTPWSASTPEQLSRSVEDWVQRGARQHGLDDYDPDRDGTPYHGPVSARLGELELHRLHAVKDVLIVDGYDRSHGDSLVYLLRRGDDIRAVKFGSGYHRTAAMAALGHEYIPAQLRSPVAVDVADVDDWPQVRRGMWSREAATRYVDHLFDFDPRAWAVSVGLARAG
jgi:hypothetical protein